MSDIYLQITETPTVVTLSAPVVASVMVNTVTVANTVTVSLDSNSLSALENVTVTVGAGITGTVTVSNSVTISSLPALVSGAANIGVVTIGNIRRSGDGALSQLSVEAGSNYLQAVVMPGTSQIGSVTVGNSVTIASLPAISGTVTANNSTLTNVLQYDGNNYFLAVGGRTAGGRTDYPINISGTVTVGNSVTIASLPAISGTVTANTFALQGTAVTTSNFTSTTASTVLASFNATREVLTIFNEGAGNLFVSVGATCTTVQYQVRLSAGDYYEAPNHQTTITHSAVFATAGTARVTEVS
jgi:hypothetical protein